MEKKLKDKTKGKWNKKYLKNQTRTLFVKRLIGITNHKKMHVKNIEMEVHYELETMMMIT
jgi:hypothetical protein